MTRHLGRELRLSERCAILNVDGVDVRIGAEREGDVERVAAVGATRRLVIERIVDAVDLLLDRLGDGGLDHFRVGAGIIRRQRHLRRHDLGKLRDRNRRDRDEAGERDDDRDDEGKARPIDEDGGDHASASIARREQRGIDDLTGPHLLHAVDDHFLALTQTVLDHDVGVDRGPVFTRLSSTL